MGGDFSRARFEIIAGCFLKQGMGHGKLVGSGWGNGWNWAFGHWEWELGMGEWGIGKHGIGNWEKGRVRIAHLIYLCYYQSFFGKLKNYIATNASPSRVCALLAVLRR